MRGAVVVALAVIVTRTVAAQARSIACDARVDGIFTHGAATTHLGLGVARPLSRNIGIQLVIAGGATRSDDDSNASARADVLARFAPAPTNTNAWAAYANAGVGALVQREAKGRAVLVTLIGMQRRGGFVEAGLGGGLRVGAGLRF